MRKLHVTTFQTLDGVIQGLGGPDEDRDGGFRYGGWIWNLWSEELDRTRPETQGDPFDLLLGRRTYEIFAAYWPNAPEEAGGKLLNEATKFVASRSHPDLSWGPATMIEGDAGRGVAALKETDGPDLQVYGSANLLQTLMRHGLVDEYRLITFPITIGTGKRLFAEGTPPTTLRLVEGSVSGNGAVIATYEPVGELATGSR